MKYKPLGRTGLFVSELCLGTMTFGGSGDGIQSKIGQLQQEEAERIVARAQEQAAFLIDERGLTQAADEESRRIIANAQSDADEIRRGADEYAVSVLVGLEGDVVKTLQSIKKGIAMLDERRSELIDGRTPSNGVADEEAWEGEGEAEPARR